MPASQLGLCAPRTRARELGGAGWLLPRRRWHCDELGRPPLPPALFSPPAAMRMAHFWHSVQSLHVLQGLAPASHRPPLPAASARRSTRSAWATPPWALARWRPLCQLDPLPTASRPLPACPQYTRAPLTQGREPPQGCGLPWGHLPPCRQQQATWGAARRACRAPPAQRVAAAAAWHRWEAQQPLAGLAAAAAWRAGALWKCCGRCLATLCAATVGQPTLTGPASTLVRGSGARWSLLGDWVPANACPSRAG